jgi:Holliday junction resolvase RusA-like endonuclease
MNKRTVIDIELPLPPSLNNAYYTERRTLKRFPSAEHKAFKNEAGWTLKQAGIEIPPGVPLEVEYWFYFYPAAFARSDADNRVKLVSRYFIYCFEQWGER